MFESIAKYVALIFLIGIQLTATSPIVFHYPTGCRTTLEQPESPIIQNYTFQNCITAEFGGYRTFRDGTYYELKNGVLDESKSTCYNSITGIEPRLVVNFDYATIEISIKLEGQKQFVQFIGGLELTYGDVLSYTKNISASSPTQCVYEENNSGTEITIFNFHDVVMFKFNYEIHRLNARKPFHKCL